MKTFYYSFLNRNDFLSCLPHNKVILELGVFNGDNAEFLLNNLFPTKLYLVDTWYLKDFESLLIDNSSPHTNERFDKNKKMSFNTVIQLKDILIRLNNNNFQSNPTAIELMNGLYENVQNKFMYNKSVEIIKSDGVTFLQTLENDCLDIAYVDANHSYDSCLNDLISCSKKLRKNGFLVGNDFTYSENEKHQHYEVINAVLEFCNITNFEVVAISYGDFSDFILAEKNENNFMLKELEDKLIKKRAINLDSILLENYHIEYQKDSDCFVPSFLGKYNVK